ncbi:MAG: hypothetical protein SP1CHLAM54_09290 [Chlamydiia bacterium]|nr:hypothetical protein [Chlamydiia bacterium]MCH9615835.1 hypothetical protein [Chlamydiia bacterium]MCH9628762.1 hypothetical protein [Chlamydiia bacterium]
MGIHGSLYTPYLCSRIYLAAKDQFGSASAEAEKLSKLPDAPKKKTIKNMILSIKAIFAGKTKDTYKLLALNGNRAREIIIIATNPLSPHAIPPPPPLPIPLAIRPEGRSTETTNASFSEPDLVTDADREAAASLASLSRA